MMICRNNLHNTLCAMSVTTFLMGLFNMIMYLIGFRLGFVGMLNFYYGMIWMCVGFLFLLYDNLFFYKIYRLDKRGFKNA